jgi:hypothetical protein
MVSLRQLEWWEREQLTRYRRRKPRIHGHLPRSTVIQLKIGVEGVEIVCVSLLHTASLLPHVNIPRSPSCQCTPGKSVLPIVIAA